MFYLVLHLLYWTIVFLFQTDLMYVKSDLFPHILQQFKWGFSQFLIINKKLKAIWEAMSENKGRKMAIPLEWKSWVKHGPPVAHLKRDTVIQRGKHFRSQSVSHMPWKTRPMVEMAKSLHKKSTKYLKAKYNS